LVAGCQDGAVRFEHLADYTLAAHTDDRVLAVAFSPDGRTLADTRADGTGVGLRDPRDPMESWTVPADTTNGPAVAFSPRQHVLVVPDAPVMARLWDVADVRRPVRPTALTTSVTSNLDAVAFSADGRTLVTAGDADGQTTQLWDVGDPQQPHPIRFLPTRSGTISMAADRTGRLLAVSTGGPDVDLWDVDASPQPRMVATLPGAASGRNRAMAFSPDGRLIAVSSNGNTAQLWNVSDPRHPSKITELTGHTSAVNALAFSPDSHTLATGSSDSTVRLWDVSGAAEHPTTIATLTGHSGSVNAIAFSPDGRTLATGSSDRSIGLWDTDVDHMAAHLCTLAWPRIGPNEWAKYLPGFDYRPPCPT
jgi:WD40 repeat protein